MTPETGEMETALQTAVDHWNAGDLDSYLEIYAEDVRVHGYSAEPMDRDGTREFYRLIFAAFPGCRLGIDETLVDGDRLSCRFTLRGRHDGDFIGVPATGREFAMPGITVLHFRGGRCVERWTVSDLLGLLGQLGAFPPAS